MPPETPDPQGAARTPAVPGAVEEPQRTLRASDDDRERVVTELGDHLAAGRLDTAEFDERVSSAYAARTLGELDVLMTDLPAERPRPGHTGATSLAKSAPAEAVTAAPGVPGSAENRALRARSWLAVSMVVVGVWGISSAAAGELMRFWPVWVIGPWGLAVLFHAIRGNRPGAPGGDARH